MGNSNCVFSKTIPLWGQASKWVNQSIAWLYRLISKPKKLSELTEKLFIYNVFALRDFILLTIYLCSMSLDNMKGRLYFSIRELYKLYEVKDENIPKGNFINS